MFRGLLFWPWVLFSLWRGGVVVITTAQLHSSKNKKEKGSNTARGVSEIRDGEDL